MPRSLADGHTKFTILTVAPADPAAPTATELTAGIDASDNILASDFTWGATDSDTVQEKALSTLNNATTPTASNYQGGLTAFRYFDDTGVSDPTEGDDVFQALKTKGVTLWGYARKTGKLSTEAWAASDEVYLGAEFVTDEAQPPSDQGGFIKWRHPLYIQTAWPNIAVAAGA